MSYKCAVTHASVKERCALTGCGSSRFSTVVMNVCSAGIKDRSSSG